MEIGSDIGFCPLVIRFPPICNGNWTGHRFLCFSCKASTCSAMKIGPGTGFSPLVMRFPHVRQWELDWAQVSVL